MGGQADKVAETVEGGWQRELNFAGAIRLAMKGLVTDKEAGELPASALEVAVLDRASESTRGSRRAFRRLDDDEIAALLSEEN
jgi:proteasome alpha subunit